MATASPAPSGAIEFDGAQLRYAVRRGDQPPRQATVALVGEAPDVLLIVDAARETQAEAIGAALEALILDEAQVSWLRTQLRLPPDFRTPTAVTVGETPKTPSWTQEPSGSIAFEGGQIAYAVRRHSRRKNIEVSVVDGALLVKAPHKLPDAEIRATVVELIGQNEGWLREQLRPPPRGREARTPAPHGEVEFDGAAIKYFTRRHPRRKRTALGVDNGRLMVRAGPRISDARIHEDVLEIVRERGDWIRKQLSRPQVRPLWYEVRDGGNLLYLGERHTVREDPSAPEAVMFDERGFRLRSADPAVVRQWLWRRAEEEVEQRTERWAGEIGERPKWVQVVDVQSYWGQANVETREINFNWRLIFGPEQQIDDVVVHELCHLRIAGHQRDFWELVERFRPGARKRRAEFKRMAAEMVWEPMRSPIRRRGFGREPWAEEDDW